MAWSDVLRTKRNRYVDCLNNALTTASNLERAIDSLSGIIERQNDGYVVDEQSGDGNYIFRLRSKEQGIYNNIVNNVVPGTRSIINNLNHQINDALVKEELERQENII